VPHEKPVKIASHLRECHGYTLAESVAWAPWEMVRIHDATHRDIDCGHTHDDEEQES
jgi:hypothetical protein